MKRVQARSSGTYKPSVAASANGTIEAYVEAGPEVTARLFKRVQHCVAPATPATWSRYIDSRLKQFCTR